MRGGNWECKLAVRFTGTNEGWYGGVPINAIVPPAYDCIRHTGQAVAMMGIVAALCCSWR